MLEHKSPTFSKITAILGSSTHTIQRFLVRWGAEVVWECGSKCPKDLYLSPILPDDYLNTRFNPVQPIVI